MTARPPLFVLDTDIINTLAKDSASLPAQLRTRIRQIPSCTLALHAGAIIEIGGGSTKVHGTNSKKAERLKIRLEQLLASDIRFLPLTAHASRSYAQMTTVPALSHFWVTPLGTKRPRPCQDLSIAATAIAHATTVVTRNTADFASIDPYFSLPGLLNPIDDAPKLALPAAPPISRPISVWMH